MNDLKVLGQEKVGDFKFTGIEGGFGESKKSMLIKDIAEIHNRPVKVINQAINMNRKRFKYGIDILDLKQESGSIKLTEFFTKQQIANFKNIYLLSERGYSKLLKILEDDTAWDIYDQLVDNYFTMRQSIQSENKALLADKRLEIMEQNAATRRAQLMYKIAMETKNPRHKEELLYQASKEIAGDMEFVSEDASGEYFGMFYTATQIANIAGLPNGAMIVGRIANQYRIKPFYGTENKYSRIMITPDGIQQTIYKTPGKDKLLEILENEGYI